MVRMGMYKITLTCFSRSPTLSCISGVYLQLDKKYVKPRELFYQ